MRAYKIAVAGAGYVGMAMAVLLSQHHQVTVVDIVPEKISMINRRQSPVRDDVMQQVLSHTPLQLSATLNAQAAYAGADFVVIAVPTNYDDVTQRFQTAAVEEVIGLVTQCNPDAAVVIKSTVPVGYTASVREKFHNRNILFSPEFLRESHAMEDSLYPSRIIVGTDMQDTRLTASARAFAALLQEGAEKPNVDTLLMGFSEAEAVKLFANTYLALRVAYFNELDTYAESKGLNTRQILDGVCLDPRIGSHYNNPSFGYGGYCLPKDTKQLLSDYGGVPQNLIRSIVDANDTRKDFIADRILSLAGYPAESPASSAAFGPGNISDPAESSGTCVIGIYRLIMKSGSDNFRRSAVLDIMERLRRRKGISLLIYEPDLPEDAVPAGCRVTSDPERFKAECRIILANRFEEALGDVKEKVYTRDVYHRD